MDVLRTRLIVLLCFTVANYTTLRANAVVVLINSMNVTEEMRYYVQDSKAGVAFEHEAGPSHTWDLLGVPETVEQMAKLGIEFPTWVHEMLNKGNAYFYKSGEKSGND